MKSSVSALEMSLSPSSAEHSLGSESESTRQSFQNCAHAARFSADIALNGSTSGTAGTNSTQLELEELEELESESDSEEELDEDEDDAWAARLARRRAAPRCFGAHRLAPI